MKKIYILLLIVSFLLIPISVYANEIDDYIGVSKDTTIDYDLGLMNLDYSNLKLKEDEKFNKDFFILLGEDYSTDNVRLWFYFYSPYKNREFKDLNNYDNIQCVLLFNDVEFTLNWDSKIYKTDYHNNKYALSFQTSFNYKKIVNRKYEVKEVNFYYSELDTMNDDTIFNYVDSVSCDSSVYNFCYDSKNNSMIYDYDSLVVITESEIVACMIDIEKGITDSIKDFLIGSMGKDLISKNGYLMCYYYNFNFPLGYDNVNWVDINYTLNSYSGVDKDTDYPTDNYNNYYKRMYKECYEDIEGLYLNNTKSCEKSVSEHNVRINANDDDVIFKKYGQSFSLDVFGDTPYQVWNDDMNKYSPLCTKNRFNYDIQALFYSNSPIFVKDVTIMGSILSTFSFGGGKLLGDLLSQEFYYYVTNPINASVSQVSYNFQGVEKIVKTLDSGDINDNAPIESINDDNYSFDDLSKDIKGFFVNVLSKIKNNLKNIFLFSLIGFVVFVIIVVIIKLIINTPSRIIDRIEKKQEKKERKKMYKEFRKMRYK